MTTTAPTPATLTATDRAVRHGDALLRDTRNIGKVTACGAALMVALEKARRPGETLRDAERRVLRGR